MTRTFVGYAFACVLLACTGESSETGAVPGSQATAQPAPVVVIDMDIGTIAIQLAPDRAPETVESFLRHVEAGFYDGLTWHRIMPGFVIQTGQVDGAFRRRTSQATRLANEAPNGLDNVRGSVAMARAGNPHSAIAEFYINVADNPQLDFRDSTMTGWGYAVFGRVIEGMDVVDAIEAIPTHSVRSYPTFPTTPPRIVRAYVRRAN